MQRHCLHMTEILLTGTFNLNINKENVTSKFITNFSDWRKFFELPTAIERQQMELIKHELAQGKLKQTQLPPISYFARDLPMLPGEAGTRLLQTVRVGEKVGYQ